MKSYKDKPLSPYAKYKKKPFRYSDTYRAWHNACVKAGTNNTAEIRRLAKAHAEQFRYRDTPLETDVV